MVRIKTHCVVALDQQNLLDAESQDFEGYENHTRAVGEGRVEGPGRSVDMMRY